MWIRFLENFEYKEDYIDHKGRPIRHFFKEYNVAYGKLHYFKRVRWPSFLVHIPKVSIPQGSKELTFQYYDPDFKEWQLFNGNEIKINRNELNLNNKELFMEKKIPKIKLKYDVLMNLNEFESKFSTQSPKSIETTYGELVEMQIKNDHGCPVMNYDLVHPIENLNFKELKIKCDPQDVLNLNTDIFYSCSNTPREYLFEKPFLRNKLKSCKTPKLIFKIPKIEKEAKIELKFIN